MYREQSWVASVGRFGTCTPRGCTPSLQVASLLLHSVFSRVLPGASCRAAGCQQSLGAGGLSPPAVDVEVEDEVGQGVTPGTALCLGLRTGDTEKHSRLARAGAASVTDLLGPGLVRQPCPSSSSLLFQRRAQAACLHSKT